MDVPEHAHRLTPASSAIELAISALGGELGAVAAAWPAVVGDRMARVTTPSRLRGGELTIRCSSAAWAQSLNGMHDEILRRIDQELGPGRVSTVRARAGGLPPQPVPTPPAPLQVELDERRVDDLRRSVESIADPDLRRRVLAAAIATERRRLQLRNG